MITIIRLKAAVEPSSEKSCILNKRQTIDSVQHYNRVTNNHYHKPLENIISLSLCYYTAQLTCTWFTPIPQTRV